jgi:hypothetical protein
MLTAYRMVKTHRIGLIRSQAPKPVIIGHGEGSTTKWLWAGEVLIRLQ